uniref:Uncharacterized protein n=1 Tax=viral metagenome TaxID=1070528 RepID=A0A6C0JPK0_9ZZZZ
MTTAISPSAANLRDSFDTLSSDGSYDSFYSEDSWACNDRKLDIAEDHHDRLDDEIAWLDAQAGLYDQEEETLDEKIKKWDEAAALYEDETSEDDVLYLELFGEGKYETEEEGINRRIIEQEVYMLQTTHSNLRYSGNAQNIYLSESPFFERVGQTVQGKELSIAEYQKHRNGISWIDDYINILVTDELLYETELEEVQICEEKETQIKRATGITEEETRPNHVVGISDKVIKAFQSKRGRKDHKRKFVHKIENKRGKIVEAPKQISKKPYPTWHKKKTGREHKATLVPRDKNEHIKEVFEVCKLKYPKNAPWDLDSSWEETTIELWKDPSVTTKYKASATTCYKDDTQLWL